MTDRWYTKMSPESYSRYTLLAHLLKAQLGRKPARVLELGGKGSYLSDIFRDLKLPYELTILDILPPDASKPSEKYITGNAVNTGLESGSFDAVVSTDTLEHIPAGQKGDFVRETIRLARQIAIIAAPFESAAVTAAENQANLFYRELTGHSHPWLKEHRTAGLPQIAKIESLLKTLGKPFFTFGSNRLDVWLLSLVVNLLPEAVTVDHTRVTELNEFYNRQLMAIGDFAAPTYRQFYVVFPQSQKPGVADPYLNAKSSPALLKEYKRSVRRFIANELGSRYALRRISRETNPKLDKEIKILENAYRLSRPLGRVIPAKGLLTARKIVSHPLKALKYIGIRGHKR